MRDPDNVKNISDAKKRDLTLEEIKNRARLTYRKYKSNDAEEPYHMVSGEPIADKSNKKSENENE